MPMNYLIAPVQQSGSPNVPLSESTAGVLQNTTANVLFNDDFIGPQASGLPAGNAPVIGVSGITFASNITVSGQTIINSAFLSGTSTVGLVIAGINYNSGTSPSTVGPAIVMSGSATASAVATNSGGFMAAPNGFFFINVPSSGSPWMKVPFYNS